MTLRREISPSKTL